MVRVRPQSSWFDAWACDGALARGDDDWRNAVYRRAPVSACQVCVAKTARRILGHPAHARQMLQRRNHLPVRVLIDRDAKLSPSFQCFVTRRTDLAVFFRDAMSLTKKRRSFR